jgi:hypothetical protein
MNKSDAARLLAKRQAKARPVFDIKQFLFAEQLAFVTDPSRVADAVCSVRAGKTPSLCLNAVHRSQPRFAPPP